MFYNLMITGPPPLTETYLIGLGKVNVICGKNNSGKSTLLRGIDSSNSRTIVGFFTDEVMDTLIKDLHATLHMGRYINHPKLIERFESLVRKVVKFRKAWRRDDRDSFITEMENVLRSELPQVAPYSPRSSNYAPIFDSLFENDKAIEAILIPPKRSLQLEVKVDTSEEILPSGQGILNYLFFAKGRPERSPESTIYRQISSAFTKISSGYSFGVFPERSNKLVLNFSYGEGPLVHAEQCGLGLQDLLIQLYFAIEPTNNVILVEEPESHLHPDMQRRLLHFFREQEGRQFFLTTHSNVFLDSALIDKVYFTELKDNKITVDDATSRAFILDALGYAVTDNLVSDLVILVEGVTDIPILQEYLVKMGIYEKYDIKMWPLSGDTMAQLDLSVFTQNYSMVALIDKDPKSQRVRKIFEEKCATAGIPVFRLKRYAIENYFTIRVLRQVFKGQIPATLTEIDPDTKLEDQIKMDVKKNNRKLTAAMTLEEIEGSDLHEFLLMVQQKYIHKH